MAKQNTNSNYFKISGAKDTVPRSSAGTGTIETFGRHVVGTGTAFVSEITIGDWIFDPAQNEVSKVISISSDTELFIRDAFTGNISPSASYKIAPDSRFNEVAWTNIGGMTGKINGEDVAAGEFGAWQVQPSAAGTGNDFIDPVIFDPTPGPTEFKVLTKS